ncbi:ROK family protein [Acerihabitans arboris]|uniref:ROK family protein n=1 Tax=Acerihabitans arboris TaxID=2691583 RepID=A0A845SD29_9GAMM|nr:ROK family protein [Acerihabitans arboris]NDL61809.1 ROK family protein [Acerihabitans arboris]
MSRAPWPDLVFAHEHDAAVISRATRRGTLKRLARGVYSGAVNEDGERIVRRFIWHIIGQAFPGCLVVGESAMLADPVSGRTLFIVHSRRRELALPGITIIPRPGVAGLAGDSRIGPDVWMSSPARVALDYFALPPERRPEALFADWFLRQRQLMSLGTLRQLSARLRKTAAATGREKALPEALSFISHHLAYQAEQQPDEQDGSSMPVLGGIAKLLGMTLLTQGPATRPELALGAGLSKPTVSAGIDELQKLRLVRPLFMQTQPKGRAAKVYGIAKTAGWVLGADIGNYQALFIARSLEGKVLAQRRITNTPFNQLIGGAASLLEALRQGLREYGPLCAVTLALSQAIRQDIVLSGREGPSQSGLTPDEILSRLRLASPARLALENNVNCAVAAEAVNGVAKGLRDVIFLQVGTHIGAGIIAGGQLIRGVRGCAGEVADIPFPWSATEHPVELMLEQHLGYPDYLSRTRPVSPPSNARRLPELLTRADAGEPAAVKGVQEYATQVGYLATGLVATLDPAMLILGGPVGGHRLVCATVRKIVQRLSAHTEVVASLYGESATAEGAVTLAQDSALRRLFGGSFISKVNLTGGVDR